MKKYIVRSRCLLPVYISIESRIGWHYVLTDNRDWAYEFDESELEEAKLIAECWSMELKELI